jgi:hypothetical protein
VPWPHSRYCAVPTTTEKNFSTHSPLPKEYCSVDATVKKHFSGLPTNRVRSMRKLFLVPSRRDLKRRLCVCMRELCARHRRRRPIENVNARSSCYRSCSQPARSLDYYSRVFILNNNLMMDCILTLSRPLATFILYLSMSLSLLSSPRFFHSKSACARAAHQTGSVLMVLERSDEFFTIEFFLHTMWRLRMILIERVSISWRFKIASTQ